MGFPSPNPIYYLLCCTGRSSKRSMKNKVISRLIHLAQIFHSVGIHCILLNCILVKNNACLCVRIMWSCVHTISIFLWEEKWGKVVQKLVFLSLLQGLAMEMEVMVLCHNGRALTVLHCQKADNIKNSWTKTWRGHVCHSVRWHRVAFPISERFATDWFAMAEAETLLKRKKNGQKLYFGKLRGWVRLALCAEVLNSDSLCTSTNRMYGHVHTFYNVFPFHLNYDIGWNKKVFFCLCYW